MKRNFYKQLIANKKGSVLVISLLMSSLFLTFSSAFLGMLVNETNLAERGHRANVAFHIAESGIEEAIWEIKYNNATFDSADGWSGTNPVLKTAMLTDVSGVNLGSYTVRVSDPTGSSPAIQGVGTARFQGVALQENRIIKVVLTRTPPINYEYAGFGSRKLVMMNASCVDSFDSRNGVYDEINNSGSEGDVGTNLVTSGGITLKNNVDVDGDIFTGVGSNPNDVITIEGIVNVSGSASALSTPVATQSILAPTGLTSNGNINLTGSTSQTISSSGEYSQINLEDSTILTITGDTTLYVTGAFRLSDNSQLVIADGADVDIYVDGELKVIDSAEVSNFAYDPTKLSIYGTDTMSDAGLDYANILIASGTELYGTIHTVNSSVDINNGTEIFGAVEAFRLRLNNSSCIHYDEILSAVGGGLTDSIDVATWQEK